VLCLEDSELSIVFTGSMRMKSLNAHYRGMPKDTDVLSFPMDTPSGRFPASGRPSPLMLGDIVISVPRAAQQAHVCGISLHEELRRLLIHGLLHLTGYDHEKGQHQKALMKRKEQELHNALQEMD
jgi:rRNA maturation RNase YbeY